MNLFPAVPIISEDGLQEPQLIILCHTRLCLGQFTKVQAQPVHWKDGDVSFQLVLVFTLMLNVLV